MMPVEKGQRLLAIRGVAGAHVLSSHPERRVARIHAGLRVLVDRDDPEPLAAEDVLGEAEHEAEVADRCLPPWRRCLA